MKLQTPLAALTLLSATLLPLSARAGDAADDLKLLPADGAAIIHVNVQRFVKAPLFKDMMDVALADQGAKAEYEKAKATLGFDPEKDLKTLTILLPKNLDKAEEAILVVIDAPIDPAKMGEGVQKKEHSGVAYFIEDGTAMAQLGGRVVAGPEARVKAAIEASKGKINLSKNAAMGKLIKSVDTSKDMWVVGIIPPALKKDMPKDEPLAKELDSFRMSADFASGASFILDLGTKKAAAAKGIADKAKAELEKAKKDAMVTAMPGLSAIVQKLQISPKGNDVRFSLALSKPDVDSLKALLASMKGGAK